MPTGTSQTAAAPRPTTAERRAQVIATAGALAAAGGYDAVTMKTVADDSGVALATLYRWFDSKDHLLAEVLLAWIADLAPAVEAASSTAGSPVAALEAVVGLVGEAVTAQPQLAAAAITALLADDPAVLAIFDTFHDAVGGWFGAALGADDPEAAAVVDLLEHTMWASMIALVRGRDTPHSVQQRLVSAARLLAR